MTISSKIIDVGAGRASIRVFHGGTGPQLLFLHGAGGLLPDDPFVATLSAHFEVYAPLLPGYQDSSSSDDLRDMLEITLHAFDVWDALGLDQPILVGHSMGGMIAAEMAALAPHQVQRLALISSTGLWIDETPVADLFALLPWELPGYLFHDPEQHGNLISAGGDLNDPEFLTSFLVDNHRRLSLAGRILFPIPDRGFSDRAYRVRATTQVIWGSSDRLTPPAYARAFGDQIGSASVHMIEEAGHMVPYEQTEQVVALLQQLAKEAQT